MTVWWRVEKTLSKDRFGPTELARGTETIGNKSVCLKEASRVSFDQTKT